MNLQIKIVLVTLISITGGGLGFLKELFIPVIIGVNDVSDAYYAALGIIFFWIVIFDIFTFQNIFLPFYQRLLAKGLKNQLAKLFINFLLALIILLIFISFITFFSPNFYLKFLMPGLSNKQQFITIKLLKAMSPLIIFTGLASFFQVICNAHNSFVVPGFFRCSNNFLAIFFIVIFKENIRNNIIILGVCILISGIISNVLIIWSGLRLAPSLKLKPPKIADLSNIKLNEILFFLPILFIFFDPLVCLIQRSIASNLDIGSLTIFNYSSKLFSFSSNFFVTNFVNILFPKMVNIFEKEKEKEKRFFKQCSLGLLIIMGILTIGFLSVAHIILETFMGSNMDVKSLRCLIESLNWFGLGIIPFGFIIYFNRLFFTYKQQNRYFKIFFISLLINILCAFMLSKSIGVKGIAVAQTLSNTIAAIWLFYVFRTIIHDNKG